MKVVLRCVKSLSLPIPSSPYEGPGARFAALGQAVVSASAVPVRIRQALNVESGLNDGLALPLVLVAAAMFGAPAEAESAADVAVFAAMQVVLGPIIGLGVGFAGTCLVEISDEHRLMTAPFRGIAMLAIVILAFAAGRWSIHSGRNTALPSRQRWLVAHRDSSRLLNRSAISIGARADPSSKF